MRPPFALSVAFVVCFVLLAASCGSDPHAPPVATTTASVPTSAADRTTVGDTTPATTVTPPTTADSSAPRVGKWIDVDVTHFAVRLMDGTTPTMTISPVAVGAQVDTGIYNSTATGLFHVYSKTAALTYDAPYDTYISNWVGFDPNLDNGFHSFLEDASGNVVDASTGRVSNGCIRTGDSAAIFSFAQIGMPVYVHS